MSIPFYAIAASVPPGNRIKHFGGGGPDSPTWWLSELERFRRSGFDVSIPGPGIASDSGDSIELVWSDRKLLRLYQDGTLLFRGRADHAFLGWSDPRHFATAPHLNAVAVVEVQASFVKAYQRVCEKLKHPAETVRFRLSLDPGEYGKTLAMIPYHERGSIDPFMIVGHTLEDIPAEASFEVPMQELADRPMAVAYRILVSFSSWFDVSEEELDFVRDTPDGREIDLEAIVAL